MKINVCDSRNIGIVVMLPSKDQFYNWVTGGWESPLDNSKHIRLLMSVESPPSIFSKVKTADISTPLQNDTEAIVVILTLNPDGSPIEAVDVWTSPNPIPYPALGGFTK